jgi:hypothetical protein
LIDPSIAALSVTSLEKGILRKLSNQLHRMTVGRLGLKARAELPTRNWIQKAIKAQLFQFETAKRRTKH